MEGVLTFIGSYLGILKLNSAKQETTNQTKN